MVSKKIKMIRVFFPLKSISHPLRPFKFQLDLNRKRAKISFEWTSFYFWKHSKEDPDPPPLWNRAWKPFS